MNYSPNIMKSYVRTLPSGDVGFGTYGYLESEAVWNLFYLSEPLVDVSVTWSDASSYPTYSEMIYPCYLEVTSNKELAEALETLTPTEFLAKLKTMDYQNMEPYKLLGDQWLNIMEAKVKQPRGIITTDGNVLKVNFGSSVFNLPKGISACSIMTMSFERH